MNKQFFWKSLERKQILTKKLALIGKSLFLFLFLNLLIPYQVSAQIVIASQPYINSSGTVSGPIYCTNGTVSLPSCGSFASETNSGRYRIGSNNLGESINGTLVYDWNATRLNLSSSYSLSWAGDTILARDSPNTLGMRNGTNKQQVVVYNTYTNATNYESLIVGFDNSNEAIINADNSGTGQKRQLLINGAWQVDQTGNFLDLGTHAITAGGTITASSFGKAGDSTKLLGTKITAPSAPTATNQVLYFQDNGSGKGQACVRFPTGAVQCFATEP